MPDSAKPGLVDYPAQLLSMGKRLMAADRAVDAAKLVGEAMAARPGDHLVRAIAEAIATHRVPRFHKSMLQDEPRNKAYRAAIESAANGRKVLDIGTGSGLLAMMAARAGAEHVFACELDGRLAATAREIVAMNGLSDRVTVLHGHSNTLDPVEHLRGGVDLVISEIFGSDLLGEGVLASLRDAKTRLCLPGARFLPATAAIKGALVEVLAEGRDTRDDSLQDVEGFDISPFQKHIRSTRGFEPGSPQLQLRSDPIELFAFDFSRDIPVEERTERTIVSHGGRVTGLLQWIAFETSPGEQYENAPQAGTGSHWALRHYPCDMPFETQAGDELVIGAWRDETSLFCWIDR